MARAVPARVYRKNIVVNKGDDIYLCSRIFSSQEFNTDINCHREINLIDKFSIFCAMMMVSVIISQKLYKIRRA